MKIIYCSVCKIARPEVTRWPLRCCGQVYYKGGSTPGLEWQIGSPCSNRGESTREVDCSSCSGNVRVKVFACDVHGECTIKKRVDNIQTCYGCTDHEVE